MERYDPRVTPWSVQESDFPRTASLPDQWRFLLRYAILAPSTHNTQPWRFRVDTVLRIYADLNRTLRVADPDRRELYISVGCALENLLVAAQYFGLPTAVDYFPRTDSDPVAAIRHDPQAAPVPYRDDALFQAIKLRHTNRAVYDGRPIPDPDRQALHAAYQEDGIALSVFDDTEIKRKVDDLIVRADVIQFADPAWREELGYWLGEGMLRTSWLVSRVARIAVTRLDFGRATARKDSKMLMSAPVLGVITSEHNDRLAQVLSGQVFERIALRATAAGIRLHPMNQVLQIPEIAEEFAQIVPLQRYTPQIVFRLGYAPPETESSTRRPLEEVVIA